MQPSIAPLVRSSSAMLDRLEENLKNVRHRIAQACRRAHRDPESVRLVAVTKTFPAEVVNHAIAAGLRELGENRVQELQDKVDQVVGSVRWHLVGHLQSNKARVATRLFDMIQTIDSLSLAEKISREAVVAAKEIEVLIQVNVGAEAQKSGVAPAEAATLARSVRALERVQLRGLMSIPPLADQTRTRQYFREMRELRDRIQNEIAEAEELSMGMTDDFEIAIEEGSTMIRVGRALFGERA